MTLLIFVLPADSGEKISLGEGTAHILTVTQTTDATTSNALSKSTDIQLFTVHFNTIKVKYYA